MSEPHQIPFYDRKYLLNSLFYLFLALILLTRVLIFFSVNISWIDSDQPFMWIGASDYAKGLFYEPRYYGQDYNTFLEPLLAVPLIWLNVPVYYALPVATHILFLFPFLFSAFYLFFNDRKENALLVLAIVLCMPTAYDIMNSLPRGFVTGLFFTGFFIISVLNPGSVKFLILNTLLALTGYFVNPNSLIVSAPFLFYLFLHNYAKKKYYIAMFICALFIYPLHLLFNQFYINHPDYVIYGLNYDFSWTYFWGNISHLDQTFEHVSFFTEENCIPLLVVLFSLFFILKASDKKALYAYLVFLAVILFSFFSGKTREGASWPFYSFSRMYLGIPVAIYLLTIHVPIRAKYVVMILAPVVLIFSSFKLANFKKSILFHTNESRWLGVHLVSLHSVQDAIQVYKNACEKNNTGRLIISNGFWLNTYLDYGGPAVLKDFPATEETNSERRYWVREGNRDKVFTKFVLISIRSDLDKVLADHPGFDLRRLDNYGLFLVENNRLKNRDFISLVKEMENK